ncbi:rubrerythrin family protein [Crocosphaera sp. XPORK-15E]|uniref:rubrerythrin family protein n=1 Tax=Crocosphaera sp. XPORK-15E TaxID=3110247 RepID=UPI002B1F60D2|nr:rubrerythrin family protein [Crocosphaera sp. XPORK-15E]MEA5534333.1 rubrerythrin family protein [Crocosphaera sp. XPORK-15E]
MKRTLILSIATLSILPLVGCVEQPSSTTVESIKPTTEVATNDPKSLTLKNLQSAYNGEANAHQMYLSYSQKADQEGYKGVASLFRSAAGAEAIHRDNHGVVIQSMGGTPEAKIAEPQVKSTQENLETAIKGESYERDTMYPEFIGQAKNAGNAAAVQTFTYAGEAEGEHAKLYTEALKNLDGWKTPKAFYVCQSSGQTSMKVSDMGNCPKSNTKEQFAKIL